MRTLLCCALALLLVQPAHASTYRLHPVQSGDVWSIIRIANLTDAAGSIEITAVDNTGERYGPVTLSMEPLATVLISTRQLERGAPEKGLYDGLGNGSGGWQLELTTDLEIGAVSFKSGPSSTVLGVAELISDRPTATLPPRFLWAHQLVDKGGHVRRFVSSAGPLGTDPILAYRQGLHELLSAYDWSPYETYEGVELGWGDYESPTTGEMLKRFSGHLDYSAFAVQQGTVNGQAVAHAYVIGHQAGCSYFEGSADLLPPVGTRWSGAAVFVAVDGSFGYGPMSFRLTSVDPPILDTDLSLDGVDGDDIGNFQLSINFPLEVTPEWIPAATGGAHFFGPDCAEIGGWLPLEDGTEPRVRNYMAFGAKVQ